MLTAMVTELVRLLGGARSGLMARIDEDNAGETGQPDLVFRRLVWPCELGGLTGQSWRPVETNPNQPRPSSISISAAISLSARMASWA